MSSSTKTERTENGYTAKITDLNFDCLASCFEYLNIVELLNVADSNKQFRDVARHILARVSVGSVVWVMMRIKKQDIKFRNFKFSGKLQWLWLPHFKLCLQYLRCCGDSVSDLIIDLNANPIMRSTSKDDLIVNYINEYCSESLTKICFIRCPEGILNGLTKPFEKVGKFIMVDSYPPARKLSELFPNLRELRLSHLHKCVLPDEFSTNHYSVLKHLAINSVVRVKRLYKNCTMALRTNPQVKQLKDNVWLQATFGTNNFSCTKEQLQNLEKLVLDVTHFRNTVNESIHLKNLKELQLCGFDYPSCEFPFTSDTLESLSVHSDSDGNDQKLSKFFANYPNVKKLKLNLSRINHFEIAKTLPLLEEIDFFGYEFHFTVDEAVPFVHQFHSLKLFQFRSRTDIISMERLVERLGNVWQVSSKSWPQFLSVKLER